MIMKKKKRKILILLVLMFLVISGAIATGMYNSGDDNIGNQIILSQTDDNTIAVSWTSEEKYDGIVFWEKEEIKAQCTEIRKGEFYRYQAEVSGVQKGESYRYRIGNGDVMSKKRTMHLENDDTFSFLYIGDIQYQLRDRDYAVWGEFLQEAYLENKDVAFGIFAGDMVDKAPDVRDWEAFFTNAEPVFSQIPMMTTIGNHETSKIPSMYLDMMAMPENGAVSEEVYSFDYGDAHFVSLNSCLLLEERESTENYRQMIENVNQWLENDLEQSDAKWKIVYMHHPMYPIVDDNDVYGRLKENWEEIFVENDVNLVFCGHQHVYMRTAAIDGITFVMANSGEKQSYYVKEGTKIPEYVESFYEDNSNYVRVDVTKDALTLRAYDENGNQIDQCEIK